MRRTLDPIRVAGDVIRSLSC